VRIFVTDGENRAALAVTRSLGRAGHQVVVGEKHPGALAQTSRYCTDRVFYPDPTSSSDEFVDHLVRTVVERRVDVLIPVADITTFLVTRHRDRFGASCAIPFASADAVERAANKVDVVQTAMRLGVPVPRSVVVSTPDDFSISDLDFPVVIKPWRSRVRTASGWAATGVSYVADVEELRRDLSARPAYEFPVLLQQRIVGPGIGIFACYHEGRRTAIFSHRRIRERPPWGGVSVLSESTVLCPRAADYATRLLDELGWHGVAMVEFKQDSRDQTPTLMEINGRFWGSLQLAVDASVDFPAMLVEGASGRPMEPQVPYRVGVRNRWFWGDVDSLLVTLFGRHYASHIGKRDRARAVLEFAKVWGPNLYYDNPKWDDPRPWFAETVRWFTGAQGALARTHRPPLDKPARRLHDRHTSLRTRVVSSLDRVGLDEATWNALAASSDTNTVFQTHQWVRSWLKTMGDLYEPLFVTVSDASGVVGVAPLVVEQRSNGLRAVRFLGDGRADYCDFLTAGNEHTLAAMFKAMRDYGDWDVMELNNIPSQSRTLNIVQEICEPAGCHVLTSDQFVCPTLLIEGHRDAALKIFNKQSLRRPQNYFNRQGRIVSRNLTNVNEIETYLDRFFAQHIARWGEKNSPSLFLSPRNQAFYRELAFPLADSGWLLFSVVELDDQPIAFHYGFDYDGAVIWYKPSFDVAFAPRSPGLLLVRHLIGYALDQQRRELDFTVGDEPFKTRFTNHTRKTVRIQVFQGSARYAYERSRRRVVAAMKKLARPSAWVAGLPQ
jgi:predicted ATP-grasp superfamily ATP-dependent carboligase/CelD/BcsL family acetyltransferase involved in cellulose biosynthesis